MNLEEVLCPEYGLQQDEWSLSAPRFGSEGQLEVVGWSDKTGGNKYYIVKCHICKLDTELFGQGYFRCKKFDLKRGQLPCWCSEPSKITEDQAKVICTRMALSLDYIFIGFPNGWHGALSKISLSCKKHGDWHTGNYCTFTSKVKQVGCPKCKAEKISRDRSMTFSEKDIEAFCENINAEFGGFVGEWAGVKTKVMLSCLKHNFTWDTTQLYGLVRGVNGCKFCASEQSSARQKMTDEEATVKFMKSGAFSPNTTFERAEERNTWRVYCGDCEYSTVATHSNLLTGKFSCCCIRDKQTYSYISMIVDNYCPVGLKFGITKSPNNRIQNQAYKSVFDIQLIGVWKYSNTSDCRRAETECRKSMLCGIIEKDNMLDGFTETTYVYNLEKIIEIYERNGGVRCEEVF